jgi:hypothetical protein
VLAYGIDLQLTQIGNGGAPDRATYSTAVAR